VSDLGGFCLKGCFVLSVRQRARDYDLGWFDRGVVRSGFRSNVGYDRGVLL